MKRILLLMISLLLTAGVVTGQNWKLVWSDEFDGDTLGRKVQTLADKA